MNRVLVTLLVGALLVGVVPAAATLTDTDDDSQPGATFAGVIGVQRAEVGNEVAQRSLDHRLESARSNRSKAAVVASETARLSERLDELERKKARLETALENGSIGRGEYQARLAQLAAEIRSVERQANTTAEVASGLSAETLDEKGVDTEEVRSVANRANEVGGGAVSEAASQVAGGTVGNGLGNAPPGQQRKNGTENGNANPGKPDNPGQADGTNTETDADSKPSGPPSNPGQGDKPTACPASENCSNGESPGNGAGGGDAGNETGESGSNGNSGAGDGANPGNGKNASDGANPGNGEGAGSGNGDDGNGNGQAGAGDDTDTPTATPTTTEDAPTASIY